MKQIELVIRIPENAFDHYREGSEDSRDEAEIGFAVRHGTPIPKGHGRLVDENDLIKDFNTFHDAFVINSAQGKFKIACTSKTIIEADKEGAEEE